MGEFVKAVVDFDKIVACDREGVISSKNDDLSACYCELELSLKNNPRFTNFPLPKHIVFDIVFIVRKIKQKKVKRIKLALCDE